MVGRFQWSTALVHQHCAPETNFDRFLHFWSFGAFLFRGKGGFFFGTSMGSFRALAVFVKKRRERVRQSSVQRDHSLCRNVNQSWRKAAENQSKIIRLFRSLQRRKGASIRRCLLGIFGLGVMSIILGLATVVDEAIVKIKYPTASAALLNLEAGGIFVGSFAVINGFLGILAWKLCHPEFSPCFIRFHKTVSGFVTLCSFGLFALSLVSVGIYATLCDWQEKLLPVIELERRLVKLLGKEELGWPMEVLKELHYLKLFGMNFHLVIFLVSMVTSIFCAANLYIAALPNFGGCADALSTAYKMFKMPKQS